MMGAHRIPAHQKQQRGAVLLLSLIILVVLLAASAALVRSFDTAQLQAGNLAFKRDLINQAQRVVPTIIDALLTGNLSTPAARATILEARNYSPQVLPTNAQGVPDALLLGDAAFEALPFAQAGNDITVPGQQVRIRYVIDRLCTAPGDDALLGDLCSAAAGGVKPGDPNEPAIAAPRQLVYRISLRVDGPRNTQAFLQSTLAY